MGINQNVVRPVRRSVVKSVVGVGGLVQRYFTTLNASLSQHYTIPTVTLAGDFDIDFTAYNTNASGTTEQAILGKVSDNRGFIRFQNGVLDVNLTSGAGSAVFSNIILADAKLTDFNLNYISTTNTLKATHQDGTTQTLTHNVNNAVFELLGRKGVFGFNGIVANTKITDSGTLSRWYKGDEDFSTTSTLKDVSGNGQDGTAVNLNGPYSDFYTLNAAGTVWTSPTAPDLEIA